MFLTKMVVQQK